MIKNTIGILCLGLLFAVPGYARDIETVLIVSIDALHPDALSEKTSPALYALMRPGCYTLEGKSVDPPKTLIAHTAMMTGLAPADNGKQDNDWKPGMPKVTKATLFDDAKRRGYRTAFYYAKQKLGYLVTGAVDEHALARDDGVDRARAFFKANSKRFVFLHVSGLEDAGTESGWLSPDYLDELGYIDMALGPLLADVRQHGTHVIVVTSDHAGHDRLHGTTYPDDYKLPLMIASDRDLPSLPLGPYLITGLRNLVQKILADDGMPPTRVEAGCVSDREEIQGRLGDRSS
jgi:predicted AlkP superfamily pyrophosphatase or phosphodiesterase